MRVQENTMGQLMAIGRTVWGPTVPTLKGTEASLSCVQCFLCLVSSPVNVSIFHSTWLDTFWTDLVFWCFSFLPFSQPCVFWNLFALFSIVVLAINFSGKTLLPCILSFYTETELDHITNIYISNCPGEPWRLSHILPVLKNNLNISHGILLFIVLYLIKSISLVDLIIVKDSKYLIMRTCLWIPNGTGVSLAKRALAMELGSLSASFSSATSFCDLRWDSGPVTIHFLFSAGRLLK